MEPIPVNSNNKNTLDNANIETPYFQHELHNPDQQINKPELQPALSSEKETVNTTVTDNTILPVVNISLVNDDSVAQPVNNFHQIFPSVASDNEIETAWVEAAKKIIKNTVDDPHGRLESVKFLKDDYQTKRNGDIT